MPGTYLYAPKRPEDYTDPYEAGLWSYFSGQIGWGSSLHSRASFDFLIDARHFAAGKVVLDAGAGNKRYAPFFNNATYLSLEHPSGIEMKKMGQIEYDYVAELDKEPFIEDETLDAVYSHSVLEHIERPEKFFTNCFRALRDRGRLYIHVPFAIGEHEAPYDFQRFTRYGLKSRLEEAGFHIARLVPSSNASISIEAQVWPSILHNAQARGINVLNWRQADGSFVSLPDILLPIGRELEKMFDDAVYENNFPSGWFCIAEKKKAE